MKHRWLIVGLLAVGVGMLLFIGKTSALIQDVYYWIGSDLPTVVNTVSDTGNVDAIEPPHVCFNAMGAENLPGAMRDCKMRTAMGIIDRSSHTLLPYDSEVRLPYSSTEPGTLLPYNGDYLIREEYQDSNLMLYVCRPADFSCSLETVNDENDEPQSYIISWNAERAITYRDTDEPVHILPDSIVYTKYYDMIVAFDTEGNLLQIDPYRAEARIVGYEKDAETITRGLMQRVVTNGGYVMVAGTAGEGPFMRVYDLGRCNYGTRTPEAKNYPCAVRDIWNGTVLGERNGYGLKDILPEGAAPLSPYFTAEDVIEFGTSLTKENGETDNTWYTIKSKGTDNAPEWAVVLRDTSETIDDDISSPGQTPANTPSFKLLAMGDSYISGEGAVDDFINSKDYRKSESTDSFWFDTDSSANKCHTSINSYPYILGLRNFWSSDYQSVACSGAVTWDVIAKDDNTERSYNGQTKSLSRQEIGANKTGILSSFAPGYLYQDDFVKEYQPKNILLSIGGNNMGFSDILTLCVLTARESCFSTKTERVELVKHIDRLHYDLVRTYAEILDSSPHSKLYVVGYPQVAKEGGNCGLNVHLDKDEVVFSNQIIRHLNMVIARAAVSAGAKYINIEDAFDGHRLCEATGSELAVHGLTKGNDSLLIARESFHPTILGHKLLADTVARRTKNFTVPMPSATGWSEMPYSDMYELARGLPDDGLKERIRYYIFDKNLTDLPTDTFVRFVYDAKVLGISVAAKATFLAVINSNPVTVQQGETDDNGNISLDFVVPESVSPGVHTLHIYTTNEYGEDIDIQKIVYVSASETDRDGDGVKDDKSQCVIVPMSGVDEDEDGIDDACDGDIVKTPGQSSTASQATAAADPKSSSLLPRNTQVTSGAPGDFQNAELITTPTNGQGETYATKAPRDGHEQEKRRGGNTGLLIIMAVIAAVLLALSIAIIVAARRHKSNDLVS